MEKVYLKSKNEREGEGGRKERREEGGKKKEIVVQAFIQSQS